MRGKRKEYFGDDCLAGEGESLSTKGLCLLEELREGSREPFVPKRKSSLANGDHILRLPTRLSSKR